MSVILLEKDPFVELDQTFQEDPFLENYNVRRPVYGMNIKEPRFAYLSIYQDLGEQNATQVVSIIDSSAPGGFSDASHNFILQGVQETRQEKVQIMETFGDHYAFFYGQKPIVLQVQGMLFNSADFNWKNEFLANYERYLRGTKCAENRTRVFMGFDDVVAQGYMLNVQIQYTKDMPLVVPFSFSLLLTKPPLDLSAAAGPLDAPQPSKREPWTYRTLEGDANFYPEYLTDLQQSPLVVFDEATGEAKLESGSSAETTRATDSTERSSPWISGVDPGQKMWNSESEALLLLNTLLAQQQSGTDRTTAILAFKKNPSTFQLSKRDSATTTALQSLGTGIANTAVVVDDAPDLE